MIIRTRWRAILQTLTLHVGAASLIGYFALQGYGGQYGLAAKRDLEQQYQSLSTELDGLKTQREALAFKVDLLATSRIDPDMLDEEARSLLNLVNPKDLVLLRQNATKSRLQ
ncbi:septum formation initiator family protein [Ancylobacter sp. 6x-1]|uniref:Septum formation initiator family protein n=1 Tax=Ancylobacter crimeensis TaxID=2579147 RepID=A0ABT0DCG8_9HYPH|nr:septum formation initiator family protein [Ancylobacter crimeensis]MCK0197661.1 septum formation initiator family protein [Ancylobacter crimeensis]